ncbi:MAG: hypothetical protein H0X66_05915 [Verrucomicrobia bacterium]|nr:hypothetical protein [Verrucomicrobiota bacterium]
MSTQRERETREGIFEHAPHCFGILVVLALLPAIWLQSPLSYIAWSGALGIFWLLLLTVAWRIRSDIATMAATFPILVAHVWLSPDSLLAIVQGFLVTASAAFLFLWLLRDRIRRFVKFV